MGRDMAMGRLSDRGKVAWSGSPLAVARAPRHYFYDRCNEVLAEAEFDEAVEMLCQVYDKDGVGRPSIPPGRYFRMLFVGQFEGLESEREIAWRCADSLSLHRFLRLSDGETVPDYSTLSMTRSRMPRCVDLCGGIPARITRRCCARESGIETPSAQDLIRFDRARKNKCASA